MLPGFQSSNTCSWRNKLFPKTTLRCFIDSVTSTTCAGSGIFLKKNLERQSCVNSQKAVPGFRAFCRRHPVRQLSFSNSVCQCAPILELLLTILPDGIWKTATLCVNPLPSREHPTKKTLCKGCRVFQIESVFRLSLSGTRIRCGYLVCRSCS